ncbi:MAG: nucleotidyltransferase domain-containing protein [Methylococcaceae bacterium]|nr:nucleotidyltransferase domain-containing protein [Methylococcaceae bacterium]
MTKSLGLTSEILTTLEEIFKQHSNIEKVVLYGSRAKGTFNERSDIDLVAYGKDISRFLIADIMLDLDDSNIPYLIDFQSYHDLKNQKLIEHINRVGIVIYKKDISNKWSLLTEKVANDPMHLAGYSEKLKKDMKEFRENCAFNDEES